MGKINLLDDRIINQIAAGEVVENPASVIKELVENSIDAGSSSITIEFSKGGTEYIRIVDNGCGMDEDDARAAFIRHATSKVSTSDDLTHIATMGFRGEALASISEVAQVELTTSTGDIGTKIVMRGGICESVKQIGFPRGTTIEVSNLFFNTPARRKFLKSLRQETNNILDLGAKFILAHPEISFRIINNGRTELRSDPRGSTLDAVCAVYGHQTRDEVIEVAKAFDNVEITGYVCKPAFAQLNRRRQSFFVNGRYIKSALLAAALDEAYKGYLMVNKFPYAVLYIKLPYDEVDVNVHPQKTEVRFANSKAVFNAVMSAVSGVIAPDDVLPEIRFTENEHEKSSVNIVRAPDVEIKLSDKFSDDDGSAVKNIVQSNTFTDDITSKPPVMEVTKVFEPVKKIVISEKDSSHNKDECDIGIKNVYKAEQNANPQQNNERNIPKTTDYTYKTEQNNISKSVSDYNTIKIENSTSKEDVKNEESIIQKRLKLHENRVQFDMSVPEYAKIEQIPICEENEAVKPETEFKVCGVLWDTYIIVQSGDVCYIIDQHAAHERFLYDKYYADFNEKNVAIQQLLIPEVIDAEPAVIDIINENTEVFAQLGFDIEVFGNNSCVVRGVPSVTCNAPFKTVFNEALELMKQNISAANVVRDIVCPELMKSACKHAVKGNQKLSDSEIKFIVEAIKSLNGLTCPHGRPIAVTMTRKETEKKFGRIQ